MDRIDSLLLDWHEWQLGYEPVRGYPPDAGFGQSFRSSRQWMDHDELNEEVELKLREHVGRIVDPLVMALNVRLRIAVATAVRNLHAGALVWTNPRWPDTQEADYMCAKDTLAAALTLHGLLPREDSSVKDARRRNG
jgi:hypothetical protein